MKPLKISCAAVNHIGKQRANNEDNFFQNGVYMALAEMDKGYFGEAKQTGNLQLYGVFDGMGGEAAGEEASALAVASLAKFLPTFPSYSSAPAAIDAFVSDTNPAIYSIGTATCGTTMVLLCLHGDQATLAWLGDSRAYLLRDGSLMRLTVDQTEAQRLCNMGIITADDIKTHPQRNVLTRFLGISEKEYYIRAQYRPDMTIVAGDRFMLCSDGLSDLVPDDVICRTLADSTPEKSCRRLVELALDAGGKDNITVLVLDVLHVPDGAAAVFAPAEETGEAPAEGGIAGYETTLDLSK